MKLILAFVDKIVDLGAILSGIIIFLLMLLVSLETILRYCWNVSLAGVTEITEYALLWLTLAGAAWVLRNNKHVRIDLLTVFLKGKQKVALELFTNTLCLIAMILIVYFSTKEVFREYFKHSYMYSVLELPKYLIMLIMPLGFSLLIYEFCKKIYREFNALSIK